jgi:hypothetical protein
MFVLIAMSKINETFAESRAAKIAKKSSLKQKSQYKCLQINALNYKIINMELARRVANLQALNIDKRKRVVDSKQRMFRLTF